MRVAVVTDSNSGIHINNSDGIFVVPMPFLIGDEEYYEDINLTSEKFYSLQEEDKRITTSQPSMESVKNMWDNVLQDYDELVYLPMSSGLSSSYETAKMLSQDYNGRVEVIDAKRISVTLKLACFDCLNLAKNGKSAKDIRVIMEMNALKSSIYLMVDTLKYLKRGGRITPVVAALGTILHIRPVLQIQGERLDQYAKVLSVVQAKQKMIAAIKKDISTKFKDEYTANKLQISVAHTNNKAKAEEFAIEVKKAFPDIEFGYMDELSLSVACHTGGGVLAVTISKKVS